MQRTKPILKLLENAKLAFSLIDFTATHSNHSHYSQTLRILSGYKWFYLSSKMTKNQAEDFKLLIFLWLCWFLVEVCCVCFASSVFSSGPRAFCWSAWQRVERVAKSVVSCFSHCFREAKANSILHSPAGELPLPDAKYPVPAVNAEFSDPLPG